MRRIPPPAHGEHGPISWSHMHSARDTCKGPLDLAIVQVPRTHMPSASKICPAAFNFLNELFPSMVFPTIISR
jgi:hypothetical protein